MAFRMLASMGEVPAIVGAMGVAMAVTAVGTVITRSGGEYQEINGYKSNSPGQPYTTDPKYYEATTNYFRYQRLNAITRYSKSGEFLEGIFFLNAKRRRSDTNNGNRPVCMYIFHRTFLASPSQNLSRSSLFKIFPYALLGSSSKNSTLFGFL